MTTPLKVIPVTNRIYDVFHGDGWENWSRWFYQKDGFISQINGQEPASLLRKQIIYTLKQRKEHH